MNNQKKRLTQHLLMGRNITRLTALTELGIFELSARIKDMEAEGYHVFRKWVTVTNKFGEKIRCKEYSIKPFENYRIMKRIDTTDQFTNAVQEVLNVLKELPYNPCDLVIEIGDFEYTKEITKELTSRQIDIMDSDFDDKYVGWLLEKVTL